MSQACPQEPVPTGWKIWRGAPPPAPIVQAAIHVRDHVRDYKRGTIAQTISYGGQTVGLFVSSHTWTWRNGVLVTGICIPGVSVLQTVAAGSQGVGATEQDSLAIPDPTAAVYGGSPPEDNSIDWPMVGVTAAATLLVVGGFIAAIKLAGQPKLL